LWSSTVNAATRGEIGTPPTEEDTRRWVAEFRELLDGPYGDYVHARKFVESVWPALQKPIGTWLKGATDGRLQLINGLYSIYNSFGDFDQAVPMLDAAWKSGVSAGAGATTAERARPPRIDPPWAPQSQNSRTMMPDMMLPAADPAPAIEATLREIEPWPGV